MTIIESVKAIRSQSANASMACSTAFGKQDWPSHFRAKRNAWTVSADWCLSIPDSD